MKRDYLYILIIAVLIVVLLLQRCGSGKGNTGKSDTTTVVDTLRLLETDTVYLAGPTVIRTIPGKVPDFMLPDSNCDKLRIQQEVLAKNYFATNIQTQRFKKGNSWLELTDTVTQNKIIGRKAVYELETITVKETNTVTNTIVAEQKRQFYIGGGLAGNKTNIIDRFGLGLLYKDRKDRIFTIGADVDMTGQISYGVQSYWKIKVR